MIDKTMRIFLSFAWRSTPRDSSKFDGSSCQSSFFRNNPTRGFALPRFWKHCLKIVENMTNCSPKRLAFRLGSFDAALGVAHVLAPTQHVMPRPKFFHRFEDVHIKGSALFERDRNELRYCERFQFIWTCSGYCPSSKSPKNSGKSGCSTGSPE